MIDLAAVFLARSLAGLVFFAGFLVGALFTSSGPPTKEFDAMLRKRIEEYSK